MEIGERFVLYGMAADADGRLRIVADRRVKVAPPYGSRSEGRSWHSEETWPDTIAGYAAINARIADLNSAAVARCAHLIPAEAGS